MDLTLEITNFSTNNLVRNNRTVTWFAACLIFHLFGKEELTLSFALQPAAGQSTVLLGQHLTNYHT